MNGREERKRKTSLYWIGLLGYLANKSDYNLTVHPGRHEKCLFHFVLFSVFRVFSGQSEWRQNYLCR